MAKFEVSRYGADPQKRFFGFSWAFWMSKSLQQKLTVIALLIYWPGLFVLTHIPVPEQVRQAEVSDKSLHFVSYLILVFLLWFAISPDKKVHWRKSRVWWVFAAIIAYGVIEEVVQGYMGRSCDLIDLVADVVGTVAGLVLFCFLTFWHALLLVAGVAVFLLTNVTRKNLGDFLPVTNTLFHLLAYGFFTLLWIQYMQLFLRLKAPRVGWLITAFALPTLLLLVGKMFSVIVGNEFEPSDLKLAIIGIAAIVVGFSITALVRGRAETKSG